METSFCRRADPTFDAEISAESARLASTRLDCAALRSVNRSSAALLLLSRDMGEYLGPYMYIYIYTLLRDYIGYLIPPFPNQQQAARTKMSAAAAAELDRALPVPKAPRRATPQRAAGKTQT